MHYINTLFILTVLLSGGCTASRTLSPLVTANSEQIDWTGNWIINSDDTGNQPIEIEYDAVKNLYYISNSELGDELLEFQLMEHENNLYASVTLSREHYMNSVGNALEKLFITRVYFNVKLEKKNNHYEIYGIGIIDATDHEIVKRSDISSKELWNMIANKDPRIRSSYWGQMFKSDEK